MVTVAKSQTHVLVKGKNRVSFREYLEGPDWDEIKITWSFGSDPVSVEHATRLEARDVYASLLKWGYSKF